MNLREVRHRCERLLEDIDLPNGFDADVFRDAVAARRNRAIRLVPREQMVGPCGVLVSLPTTDYVFFEASTSRVHRDHIVAHELGHLLCDHVPKKRMGDEVIRTLLPDLDPVMVRSALARTTYGEVEEQEAEMIASLALGRRRAVAVDRLDPVMDRLHRTLGAGGA